MFAIHLLEESGSGIEWVLWAALAIFFAMTLLGWLVASKGWLKPEDDPAPMGHEEEAGHDETTQA
jgi:hypothetical protein